MKRRRIKLIWGGSSVIHGKWYFGLFGLYDRLEGERESGLAVSLRGALAWGGALLAVAYALGALALITFWQRNPYCLLNYSDAFFYPVRRGEVVAKKGQAYIAEGLDMIKGNNWGDAARLLRSGLAFYPTDQRARMGLARFHVLINQRVQALKVLKEGLTKEFPGRNYLQLMFEIAAQGEGYDLVVTTADRYLPALAGYSLNQRWLLAQKFAALIAGKRPAEALALAEQEERTAVSAERRVLALLELGRTAEAVDFLAAWSTQAAEADIQAVRRLQVRAFREAKREQEMERAIEDLRALTPADPRQAVYGIVQRALAGRTEAAGKAVDDYLFRFSGSVENLQLAADPLAEIGNLPLFDRVMAAAAERGYPLPPFRMRRAQLCVQLGKWPEATAELAKLKPVTGAATDARVQIWMEWMSRLLAATSLPTETTEGSLLEFFRGRPWLLPLFKQSVAALRVAGRLDTARALVGIAEEAFPASPWVQAQKTELTREIEARKPVEAAPLTAAAAAAAEALTTERAVMERLNALAVAENWTEAARVIADLRARRPVPEWLDARDSEIRLIEVRLWRARGDTPTMLSAAGIYLNGHLERSRTLSELAAQIYERGDKANAILLVQEVLRRTPQHVPSQKLLAQWKPAPPAKK